MPRWWISLERAWSCLLLMLRWSLEIRYLSEGLCESCKLSELLLLILISALGLF